MRRQARWKVAVLGAASLGLLLSGCVDLADAPGPEANTSTGPITVWLSNNPEEVAWGEMMVDRWNSEHPDQEISAQQIPAGSSSEQVIFAAITAGTTPCLILNLAPSAVPQQEKAVGLVVLNDIEGAVEHIEERSGELAEQYKSPDGQYRQIPWKANPVRIMYNKEIFRAAGLDPENPKLSTYEEFLETSRQIVESGAARAAIWPAPSSEFFQSWFDFYPLYAAQAQEQLISPEGEATFADEDGYAVAEFWRQMYEEGLSQQETYNGDSFRDGVAAMSIVGPWALTVYGEVIDYGSVPVPTRDGKPADEIYTFSDAKNIGLYTSCENRKTAWDFVEMATSFEGDGEWLSMTGQMPIRPDLPGSYPEFFQEKPQYLPFADQADRMIEVPNVPNSTEAWQSFRNFWTKAVVFHEGDLRQQMDDAAEDINEIVQRGLEEQVVIKE